jgi:hypothetical protein
VKTPKQPIPGGSGGHIGAPVGSPEHNAAHAGFRSKNTQISTDRGDFAFKENRGAVKPPRAPRTKGGF